MIHDVDAALRTLLERDALHGTDVQVVFDAPTTDWAARRGGPTINTYLYDIREDTSRRGTAYEDVRDDAGLVTGRRPPPRWFRLSYLLTAWTQRPEDEHRLLSRCLEALLAVDTMPRDLMTGALAQASHLHLTVGIPASPDRSAVELWSALGGELKPSLEVRVTAPFVTERTTKAGPPVLEPFGVRVVGPDGRVQTAEQAERRRRQQADGDEPVPVPPVEVLHGRRRRPAASAASAKRTQGAETAADGEGPEPGRWFHVRGSTDRPE